MANINYTEYILVYRAVFRATELRFQIKRMEIEVLNAIGYITLDKGLECSVKSVMGYLHGNALWNAYTIINGLVRSGYLDNNGNKGHNKRYYISLTDKGKELITFINGSMGQRLAYLQDNREVNKDKINIRIKKKKGIEPGCAPASGGSTVL